MLQLKEFRTFSATLSVHCLLNIYIQMKNEYTGEQIYSWTEIIYTYCVE